MLKVNKYFSRLKIQTPDKFLGYSGNIVNLEFPNKMVYEIQVNTPEMIYAKETESISKQILGETIWNEIKDKYKVHGGLGHKYYEEIRVLDKVLDADKIFDLTKKSMDYYLLFQ
jgi:hypothetical protein